MEIAEIVYINERKIEIVGELDIDLSAECIHLGCYSDRDSTEDGRDNAHISLKVFPHIRLSDITEFFRWVSQNTGYRSFPIENYTGTIVKVPYESNWKLTLERLD